MNSEMEYTVPKKLKTATYVLMAVGLLATVIGFMNDHSEHHNRFWANVMVNGFFFLAISLGALFFLALQYAAEVAWSVMVKRILEAITGYIPIGSAVILLVFLAGTFHWHHLYHWMDPEVHDVNSPHYDKIIAGKAAFLNIPFFWLRALVYIGTIYYFAMYYRRQSLHQDQVGGTDIHFKSMGKAAVFLVIFGVFSSTIAWDWLMSIDTHWFSTLYGWYVFSGMWVTAMIVTLIIAMHLKNKGLLPDLNESHIHDVAKWMFAISFLWSYLWFSQFMLIWYSNIPEEVVYFTERIHNYKGLFFGMFFVNFTLPMVILMSRDAKRNIIFFLPVALLIFIGHWFDVFCLIMPGTLGSHWHYGFLEMGMFLGFLGLFVYIVMNRLSKAPVVVKHHPYLEESLQHHV